MSSSSRSPPACKMQASARSLPNRRCQNRARLLPHATARESFINNENGSRSLKLVETQQKVKAFDKCTSRQGTVFASQCRPIVIYSSSLLRDPSKPVQKRYRGKAYGKVRRSKKTNDTPPNHPGPKTEVSNQDIKKPRSLPANAVGQTSLAYSRSGPSASTTRT